MYPNALTPGTLVKVYHQMIVPSSLDYVSYRFGTQSKKIFSPGCWKGFGLILNAEEETLAKFLNLTSDEPIKTVALQIATNNTDAMFNEFYKQTVKFAYVLIESSVEKIALDCLEIA